MFQVKVGSPGCTPHIAAASFAQQNTHHDSYDVYMTFATHVFNAPSPCHNSPSKNYTALTSVRQSPSDAPATLPCIAPGHSGDPVPSFYPMLHPPTHRPSPPSP